MFFSHFPTKHVCVHTSYKKCFSMDMPSGSHAGPFWGPWTAILEGSLMTAFKKKSVL